MIIITEIECRCCKEDSEKRIVIEHKPLKKIEINNPDYPDYIEFYCSNPIKTKKKGRDVYDWIEEECRNRILVKRIKK